MTDPNVIQMLEEIIELVEHNHSDMRTLGYVALAILLLILIGHSKK